MPVDFRKPQFFKEFRIGSTLIWSTINGILTTVSGVSPLSLTNALAKNIASLVQYGKLSVSGSTITCNNGELKVVNNEIVADGAPEEIVVQGENLFDPAKATTSSGAYGFTITQDDDIYTVSGVSTYTGNPAFAITTNYANSDLSGKGYVCQVFDWSGTHNVADVWGFRTESEKAFALALSSVTAGETVNVSFKISVSATSQTTWTPYHHETAHAENLFAVDGIADEQDIITGKVIRRTEAVVSDGTTPSGRYIGEVGEGNIIIKARETGYTGEVASFTTEEETPLAGLRVNLEPIQDLNGYSYPWPAGGGKNLLDPAKCSVIGPSGAYGLTVTHDQETETWTISGTPTSQNASLSFNFCTYSDFSLSGKGYQVQAFPISGTPIKNVYGFRNEAENRIAIIIDTVANPTVNMTFKVSVAATAQTAWSPYSNICPITGYDDVTLKQSNHNIWAFEADYNPSGYAVLVPRNTEFYLPAGTYTFSAVPNIKSSSIVLGGYYADDTQVTLARLNASEERQSMTFTIARPLHKMYLIANKGGTISDLQLELGSTATTYEPYSGNTYNISWQSEAGTVYGGTLDVTTGVLTVNKVALTFNGSEGWTSATANGHTRQRVNSVLIGIKQITGGWQTPNLISDRYSTKTPNATYAGTVGITNQQNSKDLYIMDNRYDYVDSASDYKTWLSTNNLKVVYELAEPVTYQLTPQEVQSLQGENNIWSNAKSVNVYVSDGEVIEQVTPQKLKTAEETNTVTVTAEVDDINLKITYYTTE